MSMPQKARIETDIPVEALHDLALREGNSKKPVYQMHKWWARRLGSVFRAILLLATAPESQTDEEFWARYYSGDDLSHLRLLDGFMGGGSSIVEATKLKIQTIGVDIDPVAWFVTRQEVNTCDQGAIEDTLTQLMGSELVQRIRTLYQTTVSRTLTDSDLNSAATEEAEVIYNFWVDLLTCSECHFVFEAHDHYKLLEPKGRPGSPSKADKVVFCKECHNPAAVPRELTRLDCSICGVVTDIEAGPVRAGRYTCPKCNYKGRVIDLVGPGKPLPKRWFAIQYLEPKTGRKVFKAPEKSDFERYQLAEQLLETYRQELPIPVREIPLEGREDPRPTTHGYSDYSQLFNARQLLCLGWLLDWIKDIEDPKTRDYFVLAFSDALASNNLLCPYAYGYDKVTPLFGLHAYNMITRPVENNVWGTELGRGSFLACLRKVIRGKQYCQRPFESRYPKGSLEKVYIDAPIEANLVTTGAEWYSSQQNNNSSPNCLLLNQSSEDLHEIVDGSIDIILTDPPYYNNLSYSELADFYYAWTQPFLQAAGAKWSGRTTPYGEALFVGRRDETSDDICSFTSRLTNVFREYNRVLHDQGMLVFTFHHLDVAAWVPLAEALCNAELWITNVFPVRSEGRSGFHSNEGTVKWDAVMVCRKSSSSMYRPAAHRHGSSEGTSYELLANEVRESTNNWQSRLVGKGIPFEWPDALSLDYAFALQRLTQQSPQLEGINPTEAFTRVSRHILRQYPEAIQKRFLRRKSTNQNGPKRVSSIL